MALSELEQAYSQIGEYIVGSTPDSVARAIVDNLHALDEDLNFANVDPFLFRNRDLNFFNTYVPVISELVAHIVAVESAMATAVLSILRDPSFLADSDMAHSLLGFVGKIQLYTIQTEIATILHTAIGNNNEDVGLSALGTMISFSKNHIADLATEQLITEIYESGSLGQRGTVLLSIHLTEKNPKNWEEYLYKLRNEIDEREHVWLPTTQIIMRVAEVLQQEGKSRTEVQEQLHNDIAGGILSQWNFDTDIEKALQVVFR